MIFHTNLSDDMIHLQHALPTEAYYQASVFFTYKKLMGIMKISATS